MKETTFGWLVLLCPLVGVLVISLGWRWLPGRIAGCIATLAILPPAIGALHFRREAIRLDPAIHAAEEANRLVVTEGIPFREAYQRVAAKLKR